MEWKLELKNILLTLALSAILFTSLVLANEIEEDEKLCLKGWNMDCSSKTSMDLCDKDGTLFLK